MLISYFFASLFLFTNCHNFFVMAEGARLPVPKILEIGHFATFLKLTEYPPNDFFAM